MAVYFELLQKACFANPYLMKKLRAVGSMVASPGDLFKLDVLGRVILFWFCSRVGM